MTLTVSQELANRIQAKLAHPFGRRKTDPQLAMAVEKGHTGYLRPLRKTVFAPGTAVEEVVYSVPGPLVTGGSLSDGHEEALMRERWIPNLFRTQRYARARAAAAAERTHRLWPLRRSLQADQGDYPACVGATEENWEKSRPVENRHGLGFLEMYRRAKLIDGFPNEDGTTSDAMIQVCQDLGLVEQAYRYNGTAADKVAVLRWLIDVSSLWWGCGWPESAFRTKLNPVTKNETGLVEVTGPCIYGHETLILGYHKYRRLGNVFEIANWPQWGDMGRGYILEADFWRWMDEGEGDLLGVLEKRAA